MYVLLGQVTRSTSARQGRTCGDRQFLFLVSLNTYQHWAREDAQGFRLERQRAEGRGQRAILKVDLEYF